MSFRKSLTGQAIWVGIGQLMTFSFGILSSAILSRTFSLEDYGTYRQVMYAYNTLLIVFTLGLPRAYSYFLPKLPIQEAKVVANKITKLFFILGVSLSLLFFFGAEYISKVLNNEGLVFPLKLFSPVPFFLLPTMGVESILAVYKKTELIALYKICSRVLMLCMVALPVIYIENNVNIAIIGFSIASIIMFLLAMVLKKIPFRGIYKSNYNSYKFKDIFKFSIPLVIASIWGTILESTDQYFVSHYFGTEQFAIFSNGAFQLPLVPMIIGVTSTVLTPEFSRLQHEKKYGRIIELWGKVFSSTCILIYPLVVFFLAYAGDTMSFLYGDKYIESAVYFRIFLIINFFTLVAFAPLLIALGETKLYSKIHMYAALIKCVLNILAMNYLQSPYAVAWISVIVRILLIITMIYYISKLLKRKFYTMFPLQVMSEVLIVSIVSSYFSLLLVDSISNCYFLIGFYRLLLGGIVFLIMVVGISILFKLNYIREIKNFFKIKK